MFADDFLDWQRAGYTGTEYDSLQPTYNWIADVIARAGRFRLSYDAMLAAESLRASPVAQRLGLYKIIRMPARDVWIEFSMKERHEAAKEYSRLRGIPDPIWRPNIEADPIGKVAYVLAGNDDSGQAAMVGYAHQFVTGKIGAAPFGHIIDYRPILTLRARAMAGAHKVGLRPSQVSTKLDSMWTIDPAQWRAEAEKEVAAGRLTKKEYRNAISPETLSAVAEMKDREFIVTAPGAHHYLEELFTTQEIQRSKISNFCLTMGEYINNELPYLQIILALICSSGLRTLEAIDPPPKQQRARARRGRLPMLSHHVVKIRIGDRQAARASAEGAGSPLRYHMCRGHWKIRKTGVFFWRSFWRGDAALGTIEKDYEVTDD